MTINNLLIVSVSKVDNLDHFLETWFSLLETQTILSHYTMLISIAWWDENRRILQTPTNWVSKRKYWVEFWETSIFYIHHLKGFWDTIYFSRKINTTICKTANGTVKSTCMYKCICIVNKKDHRKVFYLTVWKIDSVFLYKI